MIIVVNVCIDFLYYIKIIIFYVIVKSKKFIELFYFFKVNNIWDEFTDTLN